MISLTVGKSTKSIYGISASLNNKGFVMHTVLVVDDNDDLRMVMSHMLRDFQVIEARNGDEAIQIYRKEKPSFIFMDILMPVKDGIEATREILQVNPDAFIVAITAYSSRAHEILEAGAKEALIKPVRRAALIAKIHEYLG